jgi:ATP phosphoribosyltransferase
MKELRFTLPKGSLNENGRWSTEEFLLRAGLDIKGYSPSSRNYSPTIKNDAELEAIVDRPQNMPRKMSKCMYDAGIFGYDIAEEFGRLAGIGLVKVCGLEYGYANLVVAVGKNALTDSLDRYIANAELPIECATEYPLITREKISQNKAYKERFGSIMPMIETSKYGNIGQNSQFRITELWGATESAIKPNGSADIIVECTSTGQTLAENGLVAIETLMESSAGLYTTEKALSDSWKAEKINYLKELFMGVAKARKTDYIVFNIARENGENMLRYLQQENLYSKEPTIIRGGRYEQISIEVEKQRWLSIYGGLRKNGAEDIIRMKAEQIIY